MNSIIIIIINDQLNDRDSSRLKPGVASSWCWMMVDNEVWWINTQLDVVVVVVVVDDSRFDSICIQEDKRI